VGAVDRPVEPQAVPPARWAPQAAPVARPDRWAARLAVVRPDPWAQLVVQLAAVARQAVVQLVAAHRAAARPDRWVEQPVAVAKAAQLAVYRTAAVAPQAAERMVRKAAVLVAAAVR
jgi:hypothetical protein